MKPSPPSRVLRFLRWFCREDYLEEIEGDLVEVFEKQYEKSPARARRKFSWSVIRYFRPEFIKASKTSQNSNTTAMFRHNFLLIYRSFKQYKSSFFINLTGLSVGIASALLIYLWVNDELIMDKFHEKDSQLYQVMHNLDFPDGILTFKFTPIPLGEALVKEIPEVETALTISSSMLNPEGILSNEGRHQEVSGIFAGANYFDVLSYDLVKGNSRQVLADKYNVVLSEKLALKFFDSTDEALGKTLLWSNELFKATLQVSGIFADPPANSSTRFDFILPIGLLLENNRESPEWFSSHAETYLILEKGANIETLNEKIADFIKGKHSYSSELSTLFVQQFSSNYLYGQFKDGEQAGGRIEYVRLFLAIALFILLIACVNFMNLSTAQASRKMKEIGVKKAMGVSRNTLITQFLGESMLMAILALAIALILVVVLLPEFNVITGKRLDLEPRLHHTLMIAGIVLFTGLLAGSYPAFYLSGFNPVAVLKGKRSTSSGEQWVRKGLVIFQFTISIVFIAGFLIVSRQIEYTQTKNLGYNGDNVLSFKIKGEAEQGDRDVFMAELKKLAGVKNASSTDGNFIKALYGNSGFSWEGKGPEKTLFPSPEFSYDLIETLDIEIKEGRSFSRDYKDEKSKIILNEAAVKMIGLKDPVGKNIKFHGRDRQIIGVVKDFHLGSLHQKVEPCFIRFARRGRDIMVRIKAGTEKATIEQIKGLYKKFHPRYAFEFTFLKDDYQTLYNSEQRVAVLSQYFTVIAVIISCLGLFGLAAFTAERRLKEIGIRKILGSGNFGIIRMLTADFTKTVMVAIFISLPISYLIASSWLEGFAYRIELEWWYFAGVGMTALLIAWLTVGIQTVKAATVNPVECLKDE